MVGLPVSESTSTWDFFPLVEGCHVLAVTEGATRLCPGRDPARRRHQRGHEEAGRHPEHQTLKQVHSNICVSPFFFKERRRRSLSGYQISESQSRQSFPFVLVPTQRRGRVTSIVNRVPLPIKLMLALFRDYAGKWIIISRNVGPGLLSLSIPRGQNHSFHPVHACYPGLVRTAHQGVVRLAFLLLSLVHVRQLHHEPAPG